MLNIGDTVILEDNNEYVIASKSTYHNKEYCYMIDINNNENIKFCYEDNGDLVETKNSDEIKEMMPLFVNTFINN